MKISLRIFRFSRKVLLILCGVLLLGGVAGATAVYIGKDQLLGPAEEEHKELECRNVQVIEDRRDRQVWLRKYIKTEAADGMTRVTTALRVAAALYEKKKPDLVQIVVLAENGPDKRSGINGRAVGADVVYVPDPSKLANLGKIPTIQASYVDAMPTEAGEFYGTKMRLPEEEASHILAALPEKTDCADPDAELREAAAAAAGGGEGEKEEGAEGKAKEEGKAAEGGEEGAAKAEGEKAPAAEGEGAAAEGEKPAGEAEKPAEEAGKAPPETGWFASITAMVFGGEESAEKPAEAAAGEAGKAEGEAAPAEEPSAEGEAAKPEAAAEKPAQTH